MKQQNKHAAETQKENIDAYFSIVATPEDIAIRRDEIRLLEEAILKLTSVERILVLGPEQGITNKQLAELLGIPRHLVYQRRHRALKKLRELFVSLGGTGMR